MSSAAASGLIAFGELFGRRDRGSNAASPGHVGQVGDGRTRTAVTAVVVANGAASLSATANNVVISVPRRTRKT